MGRRASAKARAIAAFVEDQLRQTNFAEQPAHVRDRRRARAFSAVQKSAIAE